jgi:hypothetical protein
LVRQLSFTDTPLFLVWVVLVPAEFRTGRRPCGLSLPKVIALTLPAAGLVCPARASLFSLLIHAPGSRFARGRAIARASGPGRRGRLFCALPPRGVRGRRGGPRIGAVLAAAHRAARPQTGKDPAARPDRRSSSVRNYSGAFQFRFRTLVLTGGIRSGAFMLCPRPGSISVNLGRLGPLSSRGGLPATRSSDELAPMRRQG